MRFRPWNRVGGRVGQFVRSVAAAGTRCRFGLLSGLDAEGVGGSGHAVVLRKFLAYRGDEGAHR